MATIASPTQGKAPCFQVQQLFYTLSALVCSIAERSEAAFKHVQVKKKDAEGNIKYYDKKVTTIDATTGEKKIIVEKTDVLSYVEDVKTGDLYVDEPSYIVAAKCAFVALGVPFYTCGRIGWYAIKTLLAIGSVATLAISNLGKRTSEGLFSEAAAEMRHRFSQGSKLLSLGLFEIVKAPLFASACAIASLYGIFRPYYGRKFEAMIEKTWQNDVSYKEDFRNIPARAGEDCLTAFLKDMRESHSFYLAHCFQVRGNVHEPRIVVT